MKRNEMVDIIEFLIIDMMEEGCFIKPDDPYDPDKKFATWATTMVGPVGSRILDKIEESGMLPPEIKIGEVIEGSYCYKNEWENE